MQNINVFSQDTLQAAKAHPLLYRGIAHRVGANRSPSRSSSSRHQLLV